MTNRSAQSETGVPSGTVTFLFTDLEGSSSSWDREPTSTAASLEIHDEIVRRTVVAHGGYVFSTAGDSFAVAFALAGNAVQAALDIQVALGATTWPAGVSMAVRMGLHSGHAVEREGDYFGPVVNRAARLMAAAHGGQIVCSYVTAQLARPDVGVEVEFRGLGRFRLRDLLEPEDVIQVGTADLPSSFPPLRTLAGRNNLPVQRTRLIGRDDEVARLSELVRGHRLVTLTGIGGCGKSRLALAVAAELSGDFTDGAFLVELAPVGDPDRFVSVVAEVVGVRVGAPQGGASRRSAIAAFVARQDMLIVLDNCEHLLGAVSEFVDEVLATGSGARVLATSREALAVLGEYSFRVPSLAFGEVEGSGPAIELFLERAAESSGGLNVSERDRVVIADICRHLDGVPLAIELAAAQSLMMSPRELLAQLDRRFELLVGGRARRRQRQQTLQAVMDWSWGLLAQDEQALLAGLSVFSGGWTLDAAEAVCGDLVEGTVVPALRSLLSKSLVEAIEVGSTTRYRLLETVRLYAQQRLLEAGRSEALRTSHCRWFVDWVEAVPMDERVLSFQWMARMTTEFDNLAAAVDSAMDRAPETAARLVASCTGLALAGVGTTETMRWAAALLEYQLDDAVRARLLIAGAFAAVSCGDHARIIPWAAEAADLARHGDQFVLALASIWQAAPRMVGLPNEAAAFMDDARAAAATTASPLCHGWVESWSLSQAMCAGDTSVVDVSPADASRFGGRDSWGWSGAVQVGSIALAERGRLADALALAAEFSPLEPGLLAGDGYRVMVTAVAGAPLDARRLAAKFLEDVDRFGDVVWHGELVLAVGLCRLHEGTRGIALAYLETAKRAPMFQPFWYALTRRFASRARETLDDEAVADAKQRSRSLTVESILDYELRAIAHDGPLNPPTNARTTPIQQGISPIPEDTRPV
jgi:predicted ATPase/class 3 adenylate cyclase